MTAHDPDVRAVRDALLPAIDRDLARSRRRPGRRVAVALAVCAAALAGTGVAAATGVIFADPKPLDVPAAAEWHFFEHDPSSPTGEGGPHIMRPRPAAVARTNRALERELLERGVVAKCGSDPAHPVACFDPNGDLVAGDVYAVAFQALDGPEVLDWPGNHEIRALTEEEAREWRCRLQGC